MGVRRHGRSSAGPRLLRMEATSNQCQESVAVGWALDPPTRPTWRAGQVEYSTISDCLAFVSGLNWTAQCATAETLHLDY
jgi:hypothetical protein